MAAEFGVIMVLYLNHAIDKYHRLEPEGKYGADAGDPRRCRAARASEGDDGRHYYGGTAAHHVGSGSGSEVMQRIAAPMIGGMVTAPLLSMLVIPALYKLLHQR